MAGRGQGEHQASPPKELDAGGQRLLSSRGAQSWLRMESPGEAQKLLMLACPQEFRFIWSGKWPGYLNSSKLPRSCYCAAKIESR